MTPHDDGCQCVWCRDHDGRDEPDERDPVAEREGEERAAALYAREHSAALLG